MHKRLFVFVVALALLLQACGGVARPEEAGLAPAATARQEPDPTQSCPGAAGRFVAEVGLKGIGACGSVQLQSRASGMPGSRRS